MKGEIFGRIKITEGQKKKHYTQMSIEEKQFLLSKIRTIPLDEIKISNHIIRKTRVIADRKLILGTIKRCNINSIIEFNTRPLTEFVDKRVLIRDHKVYKVKVWNNRNRTYEERGCNLCVVLSLIKKEVITIYWNDCMDNHQSVDLDRYDDGLDVFYYT